VTRVTAISLRKNDGKMDDKSTDLIGLALVEMIHHEVRGLGRPDAEAAVDKPRDSPHGKL